ncbi:hypothetical protein D3C71_1344740 [compost metagenome]
MRLSIDKRDPGFSHRAVGLKARIYLDGVEQTHCVTADEEEGLIVRYRLNEAGKPIVDEANEAFVLETARGKVQIDLLAADGSSLKEPKVAVERSEQDGAVEVFVYSRLRPASSKRVRIPLDKQPLLATRFEAMAALIGAGLAEELIAEYGDYFEPKYVAQLAGERLRELLSAEASGSLTATLQQRLH